MKFAHFIKVSAKVRDRKEERGKGIFDGNNVFFYEYWSY